MGGVCYSIKKFSAQNKFYLDPDVENNKIEKLFLGVCFKLVILQAYRSGIFPWFEDDNYILWWAPNKRIMVRPE